MSKPKDYNDSCLICEDRYHCNSEKGCLPPEYERICQSCKKKIIVYHHSIRYCEICVPNLYNREYNKKAQQRHRERLKYLEKNAPSSKDCSKCKLEKQISEFSKDKYALDGYTHQCKACREAKKGEYRKTERSKFVRRRRENKKRKEEPAFRLRKGISRSINAALKKQGGSKKGFSIFDKLPYSFDDLKKHLESKFDENMSWENYGPYWHVDHIMPQSMLLFDSMEHENFLKCWCLENLQPLEAKENLKKGNKWEKEKY